MTVLTTSEIRLRSRWESSVERKGEQPGQQSSPNGGNPKSPRMQRTLAGGNRAPQNKTVPFDIRTHLYVKAFMPEEQEPTAPPEWPTHFPDNCPDADASPFDGPIFYFVCGEPEIDYKTMWERGRAKNAKCCERVALSCYIRLEDIVQTRDIMQARWGNYKIARADLSSEHGKIKHTPSKNHSRHHSAWLRAQYSYGQLFQVLE
jgi:hypothetical protein